MKTMQKWLGVLMLTMVLSGLASRANAATFNVKQAVMARDYVGGLPKGISILFKPTQRKIYGVVIFDRIFTGVARGVWTAVSAKGIAANTQFLDNSTGKVRMDRAHFSAKLPNNWPVGRYKLDIYIDGKKIRTLFYSVR